MFNPNQHRDDQKKTVMTAAQMIENIVAGIATFFITPEIYIRTVDFVMRFTDSRYGADLVPVVQMGWMPAVAVLTFYIARISIETAIMSAALAFAVRFI